VQQQYRVGFIGLGIMGAPMAGHLADAGHLVAFYDIDARAAEAFAATIGAANASAAAMPSPAEVAKACDVVITMLPDGNVVREVALGADGLISGLAAGSLLIDTSSSQPWITSQTAAALADAGIATVDAPVSGAQWGAQAAELVFMVGGEVADVERARPLLDVMGRAVFHLGPLGSGHIMKSINNTITAMTLKATLEGLTLGVRAGLAPKVMNEVLNESTGGSWVTRNHIDRRILSGTFDDPFRLALMRKDIDIATELAAQFRLDLPLMSLGAASYRAADEEAGPGSSLSEIARWIERQTGVQIAG
jgi:3-hydroxyisobutyrate dehydrogenase